MTATDRGRRSDALYYDNVGMQRRRLCDMIANLESNNAELRELAKDMLSELRAATQYDAGGGQGVVHEFADRMRELGVEVDG